MNCTSSFFFFPSVFFFYYFILLPVKHTQKKKLHRINKEIKRKKQKTKKQRKNSEFTHLHGNILTNIKIRYSSANSIYYCTTVV